MPVQNVKKHYIHCCIIVVWMLGFGFLPPIEPITATGMRMLGILLGCIYAWIIGSTIWPSLLALIILGFMPGYTVSGVFSTAFGNQTLLMILFALVFCGALTKTNLIKVAAEFVLSRKFVKKGPWWLACAFFIAAAVASIVGNSMGAIILLWSIFYDVTAKLGLKPKDPYIAIVLIGTGMMVYVGNNIMPYCPMTQIAIGIIKAIDPTFTMNYFAYTTFATLFAIVIIAVLTLVCKIICPKFDYNITEDILTGDRAEFGVVEKVALVILCFVIFMMVAPNILPKDTAIYAIVNNFGLIGSMCLGAIIMMILVFKGKTIGDIGVSMSKDVQWNLIFILAAALTISSALTAPGTGITEFLTIVFTPILANKTAMIFMAILIIVSVVATNCLNNVVCITVMVPISLGFPNAYRVDPSLLATVIAITMYQGIVMPSGSVGGAMLHGNSEWMTSAQIYRYAPIMELAFALTMVAMMPIAMNFIF